MCFISPSPYDFIFFKRNTLAEPKVGGSEQTTKYIRIYIFSSFLEFHSWSFYFSFLSFCPFVVVFVVVGFFDPAPPPSPLKHAGIGHAMVNKLHYLVDITLIVLPFGLPWVFLTVRFSLFCFLSLFGFGCFALPFLRPGQSLDFCFSFGFPLSLFFLFFGPNSNPKDKWKSRNLACPSSNP